LDSEYIDTEFDSMIKSTLSEVWMNNLNAFGQEPDVIPIPGFLLLFKPILDEEGDDNGEWIF
tara:strand:+ start:2203 stop:2388 length:186 start_codon:yes stop_codon:yes gene_type:complete